MLVVSGLRLPDNKFGNLSPESFLESQVRDSILNLQPDYRYMKIGYYVSMHAEVLGNSVIPTCQDILDVYKTPILLLRAGKRGMRVTPHIVSDNVKDIEFEVSLPMVIFPLNPFSNGGYKVVHSEGSLYRAVRSFGMNGKYPVCAEYLLGSLESTKFLFGSVENPLLQEMAAEVYAEFRLPVFQLLAQIVEGQPYLCNVLPMHPEELTASDMEILSKRVEDAEIQFG